MWSYLEGVRGLQERLKSRKCFRVLLKIPSMRKALNGKKELDHKYWHHILQGWYKTQGLCPFHLLKMCEVGTEEMVAT